MRRKTESGNVVSSHSSACGASSLTTNEWIDSRNRSCSSVKMKCPRRAPWSGLRSGSAVAMCAKLTRTYGKVNSGTSYFPPSRRSACNGSAACRYGGRHERARIRRDHPRRRARRRGGGRAPRGGGPRGRDRGAAPDRRRVLVLRLHALEGAAAARRAAHGGASHPGRARDGHRRPRRARRARAPRRDHPRARRLAHGAVARRPRRCDRPRHGPPRRRAPGARGGRHARGTPSRHRGHRLGAAHAADPRARGGEALDEPRGDHRGGAAGEPRDPRRRRRRRRDGAGIHELRQPREPRRGRRPAARARGAVRERRRPGLARGAGRRGAPRRQGLCSERRGRRGRRRARER